MKLKSLLKADKLQYFFKNKNNRIFIVILILGIVLMIISGGDGKSKKTESSEEKKIEEILASSAGVGRAEVYITYNEEKNFSGTDKKASCAVVVTEDDSAYSRRKTGEIVSAVLNIPVHKVVIIRKTEQNTFFERRYK